MCRFIQRQKRWKNCNKDKIDTEYNDLVVSYKDRSVGKNVVQIGYRDTECNDRDESKGDTDTEFYVSEGRKIEALEKMK